MILPLVGLLLAVAPEVDLRHAVRQGLVEIEVFGESMSAVRLRARGGADLRLSIQPGTLFEASGGGVQRMLVTQPGALALQAGVWLETKVETAFADRERRTPTGHDRFTLGQASPALEQLASCLSQRPASSHERQSAVWAFGARRAPARHTLEADNVHRLIVSRCIEERGEEKRQSCERMTGAVERVIAWQLEKRGVELVDECGRKL